jgi:hypothetical protein
MEDPKGAIYAPPKGGLPFLVVTFEDGAFTAKPAKTRAEARVILAGQTRRQAAERADAETQPAQ